MSIWTSFRRFSMFWENKRNRFFKNTCGPDVAALKHRNLRVEQFEQRTLLAIGPELVAIIPNAGEILQEDQVLEVAPRELLIRFNEGQVIDPNTLDGIQTVRGGTDGLWGTPDDVTVEHGWVGIGDKPNEVIVRYAQTLPDDIYRIDILGTGSTPLMNTKGDAFGDGSNKSFPFELDLGAQVIAVVPQPMIYDTITVQTVDGSQVSDNDTFTVSDGTDSVTFEFEDSNGGDGDQDQANTKITFDSGADDDKTIAQEMFAAIDGQVAPGGPLDITVDYTPGSDVVAIVGATADFDEGVLPFVVQELHQNRDTIEVYFNDDELDVGLATDPRFYLLFNTNNTFQTNDDTVLLPTSVTYDEINNKAVLDFGSDLPDGTYRLQLGTSDESNETFATSINVGSLFNTTDFSQVAFVGDEDGSDDVDLYRLDIVAGANLDVDVAPSAGLDAVIRLFDDTGTPVTMIDAAGTGAAESLSMPLPVGTYYVGISSSGNTAYTPTDGSGNTGGTTAGSYQIDLGVDAAIGGSDFNSSFDTATNLGNLGTAEQRFRRQIEPQTWIDLPQYPGGSDEPGHRSIPAESHGAGVGTQTTAPGPIGLVRYNFASVYGVDSQGNTLYNQINKDQKERAREILEMYASLYGFEVRETAASGLQVVTGDIRALAPTYPPAAIGGIAGGGKVIMNAMFYGNPAQDVFGGGWMGVALHEIGHAIGLGHSYDVRSVQGGGTKGEDFYPGQADVIHAQRINRPDAIDIDMYELAVTEVGVFTAETIAERLTAPDNSSLLNTALRLYRQETDGSRTLIAQNDDYFSNDSYIELALEPGTYYIGVSSTGNTDYDPTISDSGFGGLTDGAYDLKFNLSPAANSNLLDATGTVFDGDNDGAPGGAHEFFFRSDNTIFVDKSAITNLKQSLSAGSGSETIQVDDVDALDATPGATVIKVDGEEMLVTAVDPATQELTVTRAYNSTSSTSHAVDTPVRLAAEDGSLMMPYGLISSALAAASPDDVIRIVANGGADDDFLTVEDNRPYLIGLDTIGLPLEDGSQFQIPRDVVVQIDAGAILKLKLAVIDAGTSDQLLNRSGGALQVLGTLDLHVLFTSYADDEIAGDSNGAGPAALSGDWGGLVFRPDSDFQDPSADPADPGIFLNYVNQAEITYGGGSVDVDSIESVYTPIHIDTTRPTVTNNLITVSANAAISANPDAFDDSRGRIGPAIHGNTVVDNTVNGIFVRIATEFGEPVDRLSATARFDDTDIVHVITESLEIVGNVGGPVDNNEVQELSIIGTPTGGNFTLTFIAGARTSLRAGISASATTILINSSANFPATPFDIQVGLEMMTVTGATATTFTVVRGTRGTAAQPQGSGTSIREAHTTDPLPPDATIYDVRAALFGLLNVGVDNVSVTAGPLPTDAVQIEFVGELMAGNQPKLFVHDMLTGATPVISTVQNGGQRIVARPSGRLKVDPGIVVKLSSSRIEGLRGNSHLIAEGTEDSPVIFTSLHDDRFGTGGTFDTSNNGMAPGPAKGDWGGLIFDANSRGSIDRALIAYGGGETPIAGGFANFSTIEVHHNAHLRLANSTLIDNDDLATGGNRDDRGGNDRSLIFVRQAQPIIVNNVFENNDGNAISINADAMLYIFQRDTGRSTGALDAFDQFSGNRGPLVRLNRMANNGTSGMNIRAETLTNESVWDDTDVVHVLRGEITVDQHMTYSGLRLQSAVDESLVVKLWGANAGFTADGIPLDIDDRIGGTVQIVGQPGSPVILTSLADDSVGASFDPDGFPHTDTNNNGPSIGSPGDWRSLLFQKYSNDRNVRIVLEPELANNGGIEVNNSPFVATFLGELAPDQKSGDENRALGFEIQGHISGDDPGDVDVYSFKAATGTEVWIDVDRTRGALDTVVELIQSNGTVLARSILSDVYPGDSSADLSGSADPLAEHAYDGGDYYTLNHHDAGFRVVLPGPAGQAGTYFVRVRSNSPDLNVTEGGLTSGEYQLQVRLRQRDEKPGSTVRFADIRYPEVGIDVRGLPAHSPLLGESDEITGDNAGTGGAQNLGNLLETDLNTISFSGELTNSGDVDFYRFNADYAFTQLGPSIQAIGGVNSGGKTWATVFDLDYSDGLTRGDTTMIVFRADGTPILIGRESNITDDQPAFGQGNDLDDLTRGTVGKLDPFIGTVQLPIGTPSSSGGTEYYVAVGANGRLLTDLNQFYTAAAANTDIRLEPINSVDRIIEDHIGSQGYRSNGAQVNPLNTNGLFGNISTSQALLTTVRAFDLSDVLLYVNTDDTLRAVNPLFGQQMYTINNNLTAPNQQMRDIVMRSDGQLYGYQRLNNTTDTAGRLVTINHATGALVTVGTDNIDGETPTAAPGGNNPGDVDFDDLTVTDDVGAVTFERNITSSGNPTYWGWYSVFENTSPGGGIKNSKLYRFNAGSGAIQNDVANNRDSGFGDIQYADVQYAWANLTVSDGTAPSSRIRIQARAPGTAGNGTTITVVRGDFTTPVDALGGPGGITLRIDDTPAPNAQAIVDRINSDPQSRWWITAARTNSTNDAANPAPTDGTIVTLSGGVDGALGPIRGNVTGLAFATAEPNDNADLYAVTDSGELLRISASELNQQDTRMNAVLVRDFAADLGITSFAGLSIGPQNLHSGPFSSGLFSSSLFAITGGGQLVAFDTSGTEVMAFGSDNEQQTLQLFGIVKPAETFTLTFTSDRFGQFTTAPIAANATAAQVRNALTVLSTPEGVPIIAPGDVVVSGTLTSGLTVEFRGFFQDKNVAQLSVNNSGMTSGFVSASTPAQGGDGVRDQFTVGTGVGNATGLAFSPLDVNLWHPTVRRGNDSGHGINAPFDLSRTPSDEDLTHSDGSGGSSDNVYNHDEGEGGVSFYFGLEQYVDSNNSSYLNYEASRAQLGIQDRDFQRDLTSTATIGNNYDLPGGAFGSLITHPFDLLGNTGASDADDRPTLYFNYWLETDNSSNNATSGQAGEMKDSARVYISSDGGRTWTLLATNNSPRSYTTGTELPSFASHSRFADAPDSRQHIQELYETSNWRQARVDLSDFVRMTDLVLRFDYSTAGTIIDPNLTTRHTDLDTPQDSFGDHQGDGATGDFQRAQNNAREGFYIDDIIIGWAERGEMITAANSDATSYFQVPTDPDPDAPTVIEDGLYQVEIRRGLEYASNVSSTDPEIAVAFTLDPNARLIPTDDGTADLGLPAQTDNFESGDFSGLGWVPNGQGSLAAWTVGAGIGVGGSFAARSGSIANNETSLMQVTVTTGAGNVTFMRNAVTEDGKDFFRVFVDGIGTKPAEHEFTGADTGFELVSIPVTAGVHTFFFQFFKDATDPVGGVPGEGVIIDDISFPAPGGRILGDKNLERAQGAFHIESNFVRDVLDMGIRVDAGTREGTSGIEDDGPSSNSPTPGSPINFDVENALRFAPGVVIQNNVVAGFGDTGIYFAGESNTAGGVPAAAVPVGKIINNTVYGGETPDGTAIDVTGGGAAIVLNNIVANAATGISTLGASNLTVLGRNFFHGNSANGTTGNNAIVDPVANPLFVDTLTGNFYLADGAEAIDRSLGSLPDIPAFVSVKASLGIPNSDAFSPAEDLFGQARVDDPGQPPSGLGNEVFHDLGAIERADTSQPFATVLVPLDQGLIDADPDLNEILVLDEPMTEFVVQLSDEGVGIDDLSVLGSRVHIWRDLDKSTFDYATFESSGTPAALIEDADYLFRYDAVRNRMSLIPAVGFWPVGSTYTIVLEDAIQDLAGNPLLPTGLPDPFVGLTVFEITLAAWDYGDAPDTPLNTYPSRNENQGPRHMTNVPLYLGSGVTSEADSLDNADATGDSLDDGVSFDSALWMDHDAYLTVNASADGSLNVWIDFNGDGDWDDSGVDSQFNPWDEHVVVDLSLTTNDNSLTIPIPEAAVVGLGAGEFDKITFARFRFSSSTGLGVTGFAADGEVEDYQVQLVKYATDFGDAPEDPLGGMPSYPTTLAQNGAGHLITENNLFMGSALDGAPDGELDGQPDVDALGDDNDLISDDENGVTFTTMILPGDSAAGVIVDLSGADIGGVLNAWIDFNGDGDWSGPGEQIFDGLLLTNTTHTLTFPVPAAAIPGRTFARFRINSDGKAEDGFSDLSFVGLALDGEVEDHQVFIEALDFGDALDPAYPTLLASDGARHVLDSPWHVNPGPWVAAAGPWLGDTVDPDGDGQPDPNALGDDNPLGTEENGLIFTTALVPGDPAAGVGVDMSSSPAGGFLNAWIDFDGSGDWSGPGEQIISDLWLDAGNLYSRTYAIPVSAVGGDTFARFRISSQPGLSFAGVALDGEVEDYLVRIDNPPIANAGGPYPDMNEGSSATLDGSGSSDSDGSIVLYEWDFEDDGIYDFSSTTSAFAVFTPMDDTPPVNGLYTIRLRVTDNDGATDEDTVQITVLNVAPTISLSGNGNVDEGSTYTLNLGPITDPGTDTVVAWIVHWDDGVTETFTSGGDKTHTYADGPNSYTIGVDLTDEDGTHTGAGTKNVTVDNVAPNVTVDNSSVTVDESQTAVNTGTFADVGIDDVTVTASIGTVTHVIGQNGTWSWSFGTTDGPDESQTVTITATDEDGAWSTTTFDLTVNNVDPVVGVDIPSVTVDEGQTAANTGTFSDVGIDDVTVTASIGTVTHVIGQNGTWSWSFDTTDGPDESQTVTITATDEDGAWSTTTFDLTVNNVDPIVGVDNPSVTVDEGQTAANAGTFSDVGLDVVTVTASIGTVTQLGTQSGTWAWSFDATDGPDESQTVTVRAQDEDGDWSETTFALVVDNVAPDVAANNASVTLGEGQTASNTGTFSDAGLDDVTITTSVGTITQVGTQSGMWTWSFDTTDGPDDSQVVTVTATDSDGAFSTTTFDLVVDNLPSAVAADNALVTVNEGQTAINTGTFSDPGIDGVTITPSIGLITQSSGQSGTWSWSFGTTDGPDESQTVVITATDSDGAISTTTFGLMVDNVAPNVTVNNPTVAVDESQTATNSGTFSDVGIDDVTITVSIGTVTQTGPQAGNWNWSFDSTDGPDESQTVTVTATDSDGAVTTTTFLLEVDNVAPLVAANVALITIDEGQQGTNTGTFSDVGDDVVTITTSLGLVTQVGTQSGTWTWWFNTRDGTDESQDVIIRATDSDGAITTTTFRLEVDNVAPVVAADVALVAVDESQTATNTGTFSDVGLDSVVITASIGTVTQAGTQSGVWSWSFDTTDGPAESQTVVITATDSDAVATTTTFALVVDNLPPTVAVNGTLITVEEGETAANTGTFSDPGNDVVTITASIGTIVRTGTQNGAWTWSFDTTDGPDESQIVQIMANDGDGGISTTTFTLTVDNLAPTVAVDNTATVVDEGQMATNTGSFADAGDDVVTVTASAGTVTVDPQSGSWDWSFQTTDGDDENQTVTITAADSDGALSTTTFRLFVNNAAPTVEAGPNQVADEAELLSFPGAFTDPGDDAHTITWSFGDGASASGTLTPTHAFADDGVYTVMLTVEDDDGAVTTDTLLVTVLNVAPTVNAGSDATVNEGSPFVGSGWFADPGADTWTATVDYGDATGIQLLTVNPNMTFDLNHIYTDDGLYTVTVTVEDDDFGIDSDTLEVTVENVAPTIVLSGNDNVDEGSTYTLNLGPITDPGNDTVTEWIVDWGDGKAPETFTSGGPKTHAYVDGPNTYTIGVDLIDLDGTHADAGDKNVTVENVAPVVTLDPLDPAVVERGVPVTVTGSFTDAGILDEHTASVNWGDTTMSPDVVVVESDGSGTFSATHTYAEALDYAVGVTVLDNDGAGDGGGALLTVAEPLGSALRVDLLEALNPSARDLWYTVQTPHDTLLTLEAIVKGAAGDATLTLYDTDLNELAASSNVLGIQRIEWPAKAGDKFFFKLSGTATDVDLRLAVENGAPEVAADNALVAVGEGQTATNTGTFSDPDVDVVTITASIGTVTQIGTQNGTWSWSFDTTDGPDQSQTVTIRATDQGGISTETTFELAVGNLAPSVAADNAVVAVDAVLVASNTGTFSDFGADDVTVTASIGILTQTGTQSGTWSWSLSRGMLFTTGSLDQSQTVTITATDEDGDSSQTTFVVANLIQHVGSTITVSGTDGDDLFEFDASVGSAITITINGFRYTVDALEATEIIFDGGPGDDAVILTGSDADDVARFYPDRGTFEAAGSYLVTFSDVSSITAHGAGADAAYMYDSPGADTFTASPFSAEFSGPGFAYETHGFMYNYGYATTADGGQDTAVLNDSSADDKFKLDWPNPGQFFGKMYRGDYFNRAKMFEVIVANSSGGDDLARFFDSTGDDTFEAQKGFGRMQGPDFDVTANNYSQMIAFASTGNDVVNLTDSAGDDTVRARGHKTEMYDTATKGADYKIKVRRFDDVYVSASTPNGGYDVAKLHDTALDDLFVAAPQEASLSKQLPDGSLDLLYQVMGFERVKAYGLEGGNDTAILNDTAGDDHLEASYQFVADLNQDDTWAGLYALEGVDLRLLYDVIAFDQVEARSSTGRNTTDVAAEVDFLLLDNGWEQ